MEPYMTQMWLLNIHAYKKATTNIDGGLRGIFMLLFTCYYISY